MGVGARRKYQKIMSTQPLLNIFGIITVGLLLTLVITGLENYYQQGRISQERCERSRGALKTISDLLQENISAEQMKKNLRWLTSEPHLAGSKANKKVAYKIVDIWRKSGLEDVHIIPYEVLLSYPKYDRPNRVIISDINGQEIFKSKGVSPSLIPDEQRSKIAGHQWLAWSAAGRVTADIVYCNRGTEQDFQNLENMGVDVRGKIALMRFGKLFRGDKVYNAEKFGAVGAILFSDPEDVAREGIDKAHIYPRTVWMPNEGVQRGSLLHPLTAGDPLTPLYPSKKELFKSRTIEEAKLADIIPSIPALPISYSTASVILKKMAGQIAPNDWQGFINVTYRIGPGLKNGEQVTIDVSAILATKKIRNVIGYIRGAKEPDRYVILGNHFDAWVYGSMDPNSGTSILAEVARATMQIVNETGWRPARTLVFVAWDAEEYGLIGSTEFVEEFADILSQRAVVYINMDCIQGNSSLHVFTVPSLYDVAMRAAKAVTNPVQIERDQGRRTLYDSWLKTFPSDTFNKPKIPLPTGGSDHASFLNYLGIPVIDFNFKNTTTYDTYPLYHTMYETPFTNEHLLDTHDFAVHRAVGQYWIELALHFSDETIIPFNSTELAAVILMDYIPKLWTVIDSLERFAKNIEPVQKQMQHLTEASEVFLHTSQEFEKTILLNGNNRAFSAPANQRLIGVEHCFINPRGLPNSPQSRHVLFSISKNDSYSGAVMAGIYEKIDLFLRSDSEVKRQAFGREIAEQLSIVYYSIHCAISTLKNFI